MRRVIQFIEDENTPIKIIQPEIIKEAESDGSDDRNSQENGAGE
ncbi:hypothetical protein [Neomoorella thermoacetica]|nr:hypothetical protein [Moorella thermoacetica]